MPIPMAIARFNRTVTNRITGLFAGKISPFVVLEHRGRKSGKVYQTPLMLFHQGSSVLIVLTYGERTDWLRNLQAAGNAVVIERNRRIAVSDPVIEQGPAAMKQLPRPVRFFLGLLGIDQVVRLTPRDPA
ncbi:MAG TPA: nitroreductase family deazaflavin-dependent oxidoreductase [Thermomicrobiales bacterium]|nr:nitroreductase family deazaflavin-dependent oxidoreductase [Thermomicrobiales bacterium]